MRLIDADELTARIKQFMAGQGVTHPDDAIYEEEVYNFIETCKTFMDDNRGFWVRKLCTWTVCSECCAYSPMKTNFCSYCGARMEK